MKLVKSIFGFAVIIGVLLYIFFPSRSELLRAIENPRLSHEERLSAARQLATFYPPSAEDKAWAEAARKKADEPRTEAVRQDEAAKARIAEEARREAAKQQAAAKAAADAPRLRAEAEEAKRKAAVQDIAEKYSGHGR